MTLFNHIRLLPLLVIVALLSFSVRIGDFAGALSRSGLAFAQHEVNAEAPPLPETPALAEGEAAAPALPAPPAVTEGAAVPAESAEAVPPAEDTEWQDAGEAEFEFSPVQAELYQDLSARRKELDGREKELSMREALLKAGERELDQKLRELTAIRNEIEGLLQAQSEEEKARIDSLVRIYEGMKAKDAARIFNTLDTDVLITVLTNMAERKSAPIIAEMNPDRARTVTILMAQQSQIPNMMPQ